MSQRQVLLITPTHLAQTDERNVRVHRQVEYLFDVQSIDLHM